MTHLLNRLRLFLCAIAGVFLIAACGGAGAQEETTTAKLDASGLSRAYFAGGCFWCIEADFEKLAGVAEAISGYTGGWVENPTYKQVTYEDTGHYEAVEVIYDAQVVSYRELVDYFLRHVDPLDADGQFCDRGPSYRTAIFSSSEAEREIAAAAISEASNILAAQIVTPILEKSAFWPAEDYHQDYYKKNKLKYGYYRQGCGRDRRVKQLWDAS